MDEWLTHEAFMSEGLEGIHGWSYIHHLIPSTPCLTAMEHVLFLTRGSWGSHPQTDFRGAGKFQAEEGTVTVH